MELNQTVSGGPERSAIRLSFKKIIGVVLILEVVATAILFAVGVGTQGVQSFASVLTTITYVVCILCVLAIIYGIMSQGKKGMIWSGIVYLIISGVLLFILSALATRVYYTTENMAPISDFPVNPAPPGAYGVGVTESVSSFPKYRDGGYGSGDISDTREFLKINYTGHIQTRDVPKTIRDVKGMVRDVEGRVDSENSSEKYGYVSFVVPKSHFDEFRDNVESLGNRKLYTENVSSQNLLGDKQVIEREMQDATSTLAAIEQSKKANDANHAQTLSTYNTELTSIENQLDVIDASIRTLQGQYQNPSQIATLQQQETILLNRQAVLISNRNHENNAYASQLKSFADQIAQAKAQVGNVEKTDVKFGNNIETVNGRVEASWISVWQLWVVFSPIHPTILIIIVVLILLIILYRKGKLPRVDFV